MFLTAFNIFFRQTNVWHSPFCIDLHESTFKWLRQFIEKYCEQIESHQSTMNEYAFVIKVKLGYQLSKKYKVNNFCL